MDQQEFDDYLAKHPDVKVCPNCGGCGEFPRPVGGGVIECAFCHGSGVVKKEESL